LESPCGFTDATGNVWPVQITDGDSGAHEHRNLHRSVKLPFAESEDGVPEA